MSSRNVMVGALGAVLCAYAVVAGVGSLAKSALKKDCKAMFTHATVEAAQSVFVSNSYFFNVYFGLTQAKSNELRSTVCNCVVDRVALQEGKIRTSLFQIGLIGENDLEALNNSSLTATYEQCLDLSAAAYQQYVRVSPSRR